MSGKSSYELNESLRSFIVKGDLAGLESAISEGANICCSDMNGWTPLVYAAWHGHLDCVNALLDHGARLHADSRDGGDTALIVAAKNGHTTCVERLLMVNDGLRKEAISKQAIDHYLESKNSDGNTALSLAAKHGHNDCVALLVEAGANIEVKNNYGYTPLMWAVSWDNADCVVQLAALGADINEPNNQRMTPLMKAASEGKLNCLMVLLRAGACIKREDHSGRSAILYAAIRDHMACVHALTEWGADIECLKISKPEAYIEAKSIIERRSLLTSVATGADDSVLVFEKSVRKAVHDQGYETGIGL